GDVKTREHHPSVVRGASQTREQLTSQLVVKANWAAGGVPGLDPVTATGLGAVLEHLADQLDVQCIAQADSQN
ncbi:hypothetical protein ABTZ03_42275, partial [Kitasatospora sp. NPDC096077]|uniref:hypothetical protein n=1 Tax=Kitasatospora sp. NPDC096077 TaxID=3155544 RepID=UPI00332282FE